jgi:hypothetical protein
MQNILPQQAGLTVGNVIYRYTAVKNIDDPMLIHVQNENALGDGYIFRETDDWSGLEGNTIYKAIPVGDIPIDYWGNGSIEIEGIGSVLDPSVVYTYKYDTCFDPQTDPSCEGYQEPYVLADILPQEYVDPEQEEFLRLEMEKQYKLDQQKEQEEYDRKQKRKKVKVDLQEMLGGLNASAMSEAASIQEQALFAMNFIPASYKSALKGGQYEDVPMLKDGFIPNNKKALRVGLAQQRKHEEMLDLQYDK